MSTTNILDLNNRIDALEKNSGGGGSADSAKRSDIASDFSTEVTYTPGVMVYYQGKLYQFDETHSAGAWIGTDAHQTTVADAILNSGSGSGTEYLDHGKIGQSDPAEYITNCPLDENLTAGKAIAITITDGQDVYSAVQYYAGGSVIYNIGGFSLYVYSDHVGLPNYSGSYRDIYCDIVGI